VRAPPSGMVPVGGRLGVPDVRKSRGDAEFRHAWRPLDAVNRIVRRHWTPKNCYLSVVGGTHVCRTRAAKLEINSESSARVDVLITVRAYYAKHV